MQDHGRGNKAPFLGAEDAFQCASGCGAIETSPNVEANRHRLGSVKPVVVAAVEHVLCRPRHIADILRCAEDQPICRKQIIRHHIKRRDQARGDVPSIGYTGATQRRITEDSGVNRGCMGDDQ